MGEVTQPERGGAGMEALAAGVRATETQTRQGRAVLQTGALYLHALLGR